MPSPISVWYLNHFTLKLFRIWKIKRLNKRFRIKRTNFLFFWPKLTFRFERPGLNKRRFDHFKPPKQLCHKHKVVTLKHKETHEHDWKTEDTSWNYTFTFFSCLYMPHYNNTTRLACVRLVCNNLTAQIKKAFQVKILH